MPARALACSAKSGGGGKRRLSSNRASIASVVMGCSSSRRRIVACRKFTRAVLGRNRLGRAYRLVGNGPRRHLVRRAHAELRDTRQRGNALPVGFTRARRRHRLLGDVVRRVYG